jgi:hypothetical protein
LPNETSAVPAKNADRISRHQNSIFRDVKLVRPKINLTKVTFLEAKKSPSKNQHFTINPPQLHQQITIKKHSLFPQPPSKTAVDPVIPHTNFFLKITRPKILPLLTSGLNRE